MENRKKTIIKLSIGLLVVLLTLTFFSNTFHNLNVAGVVVGFEIDEMITTTYRGYGILEVPEKETILYAEYTGLITFFVEDGDTVSLNDPLFDIHTTLERNQVLDQIAFLRNRHHSLPRININENDEEIKRLQALLEEEDGDIHYSVTHYAPGRGVVHFSSAVEYSLQVSLGQGIMRLVEQDGNDLLCEIYFPESFVSKPPQYVRRRTTFNIPVLEKTDLQGDMRNITSVDGRLLAEFSLDVPGAKGGERVEVIIEDMVSPRDHVLPNYAIREDSRGDFILIAKRESNTLLGDVFYAERVNIKVTRRGDFVSSFTMSEELEDPIIMQSDRPISDGDRIRVVGEE